jgi:hypothetical protein
LSEKHKLKSAKKRHSIQVRELKIRGNINIKYEISVPTTTNGKEEAILVKCVYWYLEREIT